MNILRSLLKNVANGLKSLNKRLNNWARARYKLNVTHLADPNYYIDSQKFTTNMRKRDL